MMERTKHDKGINHPLFSRHLFQFINDHFNLEFLRSEGVCSILIRIVIAYIYLVKKERTMHCIMDEGSKQNLLRLIALKKGIEFL